MQGFTRFTPCRGLLFLAILVCALLPAGVSPLMAATQQESLHTAIQSFEALTQDKQKGMWRDSWEKLEARFESIGKQGADYAAEAFFYQARCREELADRSKRKSDWQEAEQLYAGFGARYKKHPLADNAAYNRAMILSGALDDNTAAIRVLDALTAEYPDGDAFSDAIVLRERLTPESPAQARTAGGAPRQAGSSELERQKQFYAAAASEWRSLLVDNKRGNLRENWLNLERSFDAALKAAPNGDEAHKAAFQVARSREELARRSGLKDDWREAASLFAAMAEAYPQSSLADDSLYSQAEILSGRLSSPAEAKSALNALLSRYPNGDMAAKARKLMSELAASGQSTASPPASPAAKPAASTAAATQKISGAGGSHSTKAPAQGALLRHLKWEGDESAVTITLELAGKAKYRRTTLAANTARNLPRRARLDLLSCGIGPNLRQNITLTGTPVSAIGISAQSGGVTRVDLDLAAARSYKVSVLQDPYRLQIEVHADKLISGGEDLSKIKAVSSAPAKSAAANGNIVEQLGLGIKTIMIDAGHGGKDPGATGNGMRESAVTLDLAQKLGAELKKKGFTVMYTRGNNSFVALEDRTGLANNKKADIFVSIHVNASTNKGLHGLETYYLDVARSDAARVVAARENAVNVGTASDLQFILSDLTRNTKKEESLALAQQVQKACMNRLGRAGFKTRSNGVRSAPFYVLMGARMPAFLIEIGYLSNAAEAARIKNPKYIQAIANGIADGIAAYQKQLDRLAR